MGGSQAYTIRQMAKRAGLTLRTLRFYEERGVLTPTRTGRTRQYGELLTFHASEQHIAWRRRERRSGRMGGSHHKSTAGSQFQAEVAFGLDIGFSWASLDRPANAVGCLCYPVDCTPTTERDGRVPTGNPRKGGRRA
ncbi:MAG TPA: MerR family transcriptional regulator [Bosea sp. (in: a-proteobacteria)]|jgi:hypothetical protein|uniref:MerR family transcriptional regulator n=1 Tax=Bosea sp. (in: a-proteobacteria) TaxID=1871050 RepID=UPI002DDD6310|nr:MerR family transcriptional regulator [Bosea sp. (in: a-proteobacteria)]HEV2554933.1 MerR family transcriptional regulator [Bosea sp. (in: a-proteobacteria)]